MDGDIDRIKRNSAWNLAGIGALAAAGIVLNVIVVRYYSAAVLGVFSQVLAVYVILSQVAAGGIQFSTLKYVSESPGDHRANEVIVSAALVLAAGLAAAVCALVWAARPWIGAIFGSGDVGTGLGRAVPALWFFSLNKVLLAAVNGEERMRRYAGFQALRFGLILALVAVLCASSVDGARLPAALSGAEGILFVLLGGDYLRDHRFRFARGGPWPGRHLRFAGRAAPGCLLTDANTRIDILMLGVFLSDRAVGVYSFAAMIAEGFAQIPVAVLLNVNPRLSRLVKQGDLPALAPFVARVRSFVLPVMLAAGAAVIALYPLFCRTLAPGIDAAASGRVLLILLGGIVACSGYLPFQMLLSQAAFPGRYTLYTASIVGTNLVLNALLIPLWGICGAAAATSLAWVASVVYLKRFVRGALGIAI